MKKIFDFIKLLLETILRTSKEIYEDQKRAEEETKKTVDGVNEIIKEEGKQEISAGLIKSAKFLPIMGLVNPVYVKDKKGGMIPRWKKPSDLIKRYLGERALKEYPTAAVNKYAGRLYLGGKCGKVKNVRPQFVAEKSGQEPKDMSSQEKGGSKKIKSNGKSLLEKLRNNEL